MSVEIIQRWWLLGFAILALLMYFFGYAGYMVQNDAKKRGLGKAAVTFWSVGVVFFGPIFLPLYLIFRSKVVFVGAANPETERKQYKLCPHCGEENAMDEQVCRKCRKYLDTVLMPQGTKTCPYCGTTNPVENARCLNCQQLIGIEEEED